MESKYRILRFAKYKGPEIGHIEAHNEQAKGKYVDNLDVDISRSKHNFHLIKSKRRYCAETEKQIAAADGHTRSNSM